MLRYREREQKHSRSPRMEQLAGETLLWMGSYVLATAVGVLAVRAPRMFYRHRLRKPVAAAYDNLAKVHEPAILDPAQPVNMDYMREISRRDTDLLTNNLRRAGFFPPAPIGDEKSYAQWFEFLREVRRELS